MSSISAKTLFYLTTLTVTIAVLGVVHVRTQTTLLGYDIGRLKDEESIFLKKRSLLTVELAKISTREKLLEKTQEHSSSPAFATR